MSDLRQGGQGEYRLAGKVAVVTGGSSGIGAAAIRRLAAAGARVVVGYNAGADRAAALVAELPGEGHLALRIPMEDSAAIAAAAAEVERICGRADILVNSAGVTRAVPPDAAMLSIWPAEMMENAPSAGLPPLAGQSAMRMVYFAWVRERIGVARERVTTDATTARALLADLAARDDRHAVAFADLGALRVAIDQELADLDAPLLGAREIAVFPPMTGG
jgi:molybdopterin converting factor subunit 1